MSTGLFERFLDPAERSSAVVEVGEMGERGAQLLETLFSGQAKNAFGAPYKDIGAHWVAVEASVRLGRLALRLEPYLAQAVIDGSATVARALRELGSLSPASVDALAAATKSDKVDPAVEAAVTLLVCGENDHPALASLNENLLRIARRAAAAHSEGTV